ncbi:hypothetical protein N9917_00745 [Deltaproteobacteria bacterium]|nr:hypothetical protein [Deltaproteobacteria bacterium]
MGGTFRFVDEKGIPLEVVVERLHDNGLMMDWLDFHRDSVEQGWPSKRTIGRLREAVGDVYGPKWAEEWLRRMLLHVERLEGRNKPP